MNYYILSLKHRNPECLLWWGPDDSGYRMCLDDAGKYSEETVNANRSYYDDKKDTVAIPCHMAEEYAVKVVSAENMHKFLKYTGERA